MDDLERNPAASRAIVRPALALSPVAEELHKPMFILFLLCWSVLAVGELLGINTSVAWRPGQQLLLTFGAGLACFGLARDLPWQNVVGASITMGALGLAAEWLSAATGLPFGAQNQSQQWPDHNPFTQDLRLPASWFVILVFARGHVRFALRAWRRERRHGVWTICIASVLAALFDFSWQALESGDDKNGLSSRAVEASPWLLSVAIFLIKSTVACGVMLASAPWLIKKQPTRHRDDPYSSIAWLLGAAYVFLAHRPGAPWAFCLGLVAGSVALILLPLFIRRSTGSSNG